MFPFLFTTIKIAAGERTYPYYLQGCASATRVTIFSKYKNSKEFANLLKDKYPSLFEDRKY